MNVTSTTFDASALVKHLREQLPHHQIDWEATGRCPSITDADCVVVTSVTDGMGVKIKQPLVKIVYDERDSLTMIPLPGAGPTSITDIRSALVTFMP